MQELKNKDAAVVVFSGGQDSTTCLFWALKRYKKVIALSFDYHQKHVKELECAKKICRDMFIKSLNTTLCLAMDYQFDIITPLMWLDKKETWALADELGAFDIIRNETLTCYNGIIGDGCGHCPSCKLRKKGLDAYLASK